MFLEKKRLFNNKDKNTDWKMAQSAGAAEYTDCISAEE